MAKNGTLFGVGNPLLDILAKVAPGYVARWNLDLNAQINAEESHFSLFDEVVNFFEVDYVPGGCTLNTLRVCKWLSGQQGKAVFSGCIGDDKFGAILENRIRHEGVIPLLNKSQSSHMTGKAVSLITKFSSKSICTFVHLLHTRAHGLIQFLSRNELF